MHSELWDMLLSWYAQHKRDLPWRRTHDPYAILVAETMLQQTGVERVMPKYNAFLAQLPTLHHLADAPVADVIRLWAGLGYNRRSVWLQRAARLAIQRWNGLPSAVEDLLSLPGVGPYTARAVACFAFGAQVPVCDTNVRRVLTRVLRGAGADQALADARLLALAESVLPPGRAYEWNQALMDLGATICTHDAPRCLICPLQHICKAFPAAQIPERAPQQLLAEAKPRWKETTFKGSRRYYRGRLVAALRSLDGAHGITLSDLGPIVREKFTEADLPWLEGLIEELKEDGLVMQDADGAVRLPS